MASACPYRLADIVKHYPGAAGCACVSPENIGCKYLNRTSAKGNISVLAVLVASKVETNPWLKASPNVTFVHIRAGDGIVGPNCFHHETDCRSNEYKQRYSRGKAYFDSLDFPPPPYVLLANTKHHTASDIGIPHQEKYMRHVLNYFSALGPTFAKVNGNVDDDFTILATAKRLILTGGGFGKLAAAVAVHQYGPNVTIARKN